ncbi:hypothetical protein BN1708_018256, partial [Verticillium longisporum]
MRLWRSTVDVSQESKLSSRIECESVECRYFSLVDKRRVLDVTGRTTWDRDDRNELIVSVADRPLLDCGGDLESMEMVSLVQMGVGDVWL